MKKLFLLRHAQTMPSEDSSDIERKLTPNGIEDAKMLGLIMKSKDYVPHFIFCSPAVRTRETLDGVMNEFSGTRTDYPPKMYNATRADLYHFIQGTAEDVENLMIVAHNPGIHEVAAILAHEDSPHINKLARGYKPGTLSVFECDCKNWATIQPGANMLIDLLDPLDYNAPAAPTRWT